MSQRRLLIQQLRDPQCTRCSLSKTTAGSICVMGRGSPRSPYMLVGEAPGAAEESTGKPFMGRAGQLLNSLLSKVGIKNPYITNVVKCRPPDNRKPTGDEVGTCGSTFLEREFTIVAPRVIILLGRSAVDYVLCDLWKQRNRPVRLERGWFIATYHPAFALRSGAWAAREIQRALESAKELVNEDIQQSV